MADVGHHEGLDAMLRQRVVIGRLAIRIDGDHG